MTFAVHMGKCRRCNGWHYLYTDLCYECREDEIRPVILNPGESEKAKELEAFGQEMVILTERAKWVQQ